MDVRPHPHIGLATVTYLFEGSILHRDTLGSEQLINPGDINWMTAGRGIAHSERTPTPLRQTPRGMHGLQLWVALPKEHEETAPAFFHHGVAALPLVDDRGVQLRVLAGSAFGVVSPVATLSPLFYVDALLPTGAVLPLPSEHAERAIYVIEGSLTTGSERVLPRQMVTLPRHATPTLRAELPTRAVVLGGEPLGPRHMWWNFVSSSKERIEQAKHDWEQRRFGVIPGDEHERIPLPSYS